MYTVVTQSICKAKYLIFSSLRNDNLRVFFLTVRQMSRFSCFDGGVFSMYYVQSSVK